MHYEIVTAGVIVSLIFIELTGISPAGLIVPGYLALSLQTPGRIVYTLAVSLLAWGGARLLGNWMILYGRRRFAVLVILSFFLDLAITRLGLLAYDPGIIGVLIPGIAAQEMEKQGIVKSLAALAVRRSQWKSFAAMAASGMACSLFFGQSFLVEQVLRSNYFDTYSAYDQGRWVDAVMLCRYFGWVLMAAALVCVVWCLLRRPAARYTALLTLAQPVLCLLLFTRVQSHGQQHLLLYLPALCAALALGLEALPARRPVRAGAWVLALCMLGSSLLPRPQPASPQEIGSLAPLPTFTYAPPQRSDLAQLVALRVYVDGLSAQEPKTAAVIASSFVFNSSIFDNTLRSAGIPQPEGPKTAVATFATVDKRDGFSWAALECDYLIVAAPIQYHLGEENQHLVTVLAQPVLEGTGIGTAYRRLDVSFPLQDGVTVYVYERTRDIAPEEYRAISAELTALYPEYAAQYHSPV